MDHQDWREVVLRGKRSKEQNIRDGNYTVGKKRQENRHIQKLEQESESFEHQKVSYNLAQAIQQGRCDKGWSRQELAQRLNVKVSVVADYETRKAIPNNLLLQKLSRLLGVTLKKNM